jgi:hypothetical protein
LAATGAVVVGVAPVAPAFEGIVSEGAAGGVAEASGGAVGGGDVSLGAGATGVEAVTGVDGAESADVVIAEGG